MAGKVLASTQRREVGEGGLASQTQGAGRREVPAGKPPVPPGQLCLRSGGSCEEMALLGSASATCTSSAVGNPEAPGT